MIRVDDRLTLPAHEVRFAASRSSGPGGQNVNKVATRVTLTFDVAASQALTAEQKALLVRRLGRRLTRDGLLRVSAQERRSQAANRELAAERLAALLRRALAPERPRRATAPPAAADERRLERKRRRAQRKAERRPASDD